MSKENDTVDDTLYYFGIYNFSVILLDQQVIKSTDNCQFLQKFKFSVLIHPVGFKDDPSQFKMRLS